MHDGLTPLLTPCTLLGCCTDDCTASLPVHHLVSVVWVCVAKLRYVVCRSCVYIVSDAGGAASRKRRAKATMQSVNRQDHGARVMMIIHVVEISGLRIWSG